MEGMFDVFFRDVKSLLLSEPSVIISGASYMCRYWLHCKTVKQKNGDRSNQSKLPYSCLKKRTFLQLFDNEQFMVTFLRQQTKLTYLTLTLFTWFYLTPVTGTINKGKPAQPSTVVTGTNSSTSTNSSMFTSLLRRYNGDTVINSTEVLYHSV